MTHGFKQVFCVLAISAISTLSTTAYAGGEGCNSKKGHGEISADALKNFDKKHSWHKFDSVDDAEKINKQEGAGKQTAPASGLIES